MRRSPLIHPFSRRAFLRGVGVSMALPWLESLPVWGDELAPRRGGRSRRFGLPACFPAMAFIARSGGRGRREGDADGKVLDPLEPSARR